MRWLNLKSILFSLLSFFLIFSAVAEYSKNSNDKDLGPGNVNTLLTAEPKALEVREHCIRYNGGIDPDCQYSMFQIENERESKLHLDDIEKELATKQLQEIIDSAQSNFEAFDLLLSQIKGNGQCLNEPFGATLAKLEESKNILSTIMNRVLICDSKLVLNPKTYSKPDFEHIFLNEIHSERGLELYYELTNGPFENQQHRDMVTLLDKTVKSIGKIPTLCEAKWNAERNIETAVDYTYGYKPALSDSNNLPWIKYGREDSGYGNDETKEVRDDTADAEPVLVSIPTANA